MSHSYFLDENIRTSVSEALATSGVERIRIQDSEMFGASDPDILDWTAKRDMVIVSHDRRTLITHFWDYVEATGSHPGLVMIHNRYQKEIGRIAGYLGELQKIDLGNNVWWYPELPAGRDKDSQLWK
jgi:predicted nuclease of predicted toxin-antitoxin system